MPVVAIVLVAGMISLNTHASPKPHQPTITVTQTSNTKPNPKPAPKKPVKVAKKSPTYVAPTIPKSIQHPVTAPKPTAKAVTPSPVSNVHHLDPKPTTSTSTGSSGSGSSSSGSTSTQSVSYTSTNWSGYLAASGTYTGVSASWIAPQPTGNGTSTTADASWIGIGGVTSGDLIQIGTDNDIAANGKVSTEAFYEMLPSASVTVPGVKVSPGDSISASISEVSSGQWKISITDSTSNQTYSATVSYTSSHSSAEWIEEDPSYSSGQLVPFDNFGTVTFSGAAAIVGGISQDLSATSPSPITMVNSSGNPIATPSSIGGTGFTITHN